MNATAQNVAGTAVAAPMQLCTFTVEGRAFAFDALDVREINTELAITPVPHAPDHVRGLVNVRGQIFLICDLGQIFVGRPTEVADGARLILLKDHVGPTCGVLVDAVGEIFDLDRSQILKNTEDEQAISASLGRGTDRLISGLYKLPNDLVVVLDPRRLVNGEHRDV